MSQPRTIAELRASGYKPQTIKQEMRHNLVAKMKAGDELFPGVIGYDTTVIPQVENAILSGQDIVLLGERGQAKTRIARSLINLLDASIPVISGCEINDDPFMPVCAPCRERVAEMGEEVPISWLAREARYGEKLATPDITIADLIGEIDPIKVAEGRYLSDEMTIAYGLVPGIGIFFEQSHHASWLAPEQQDHENSEAEQNQRPGQRQADFAKLEQIRGGQERCARLSRPTS